MAASLAQVCLLVVWLFSFLLGVHAPNEQLCIAYTLLFSMHLPWPEPGWYYSVWFAWNWPTFAPKGRPKASEASLREELEVYRRDHPGQPLSARSGLHQKLKRVNMLHLLEEMAQGVPGPEPLSEAALREELEAYRRDHPGQPLPARSGLHQKLKRAGLLRLLPLSGCGSDTQKLDDELRQGVLNFLEDKTVFDCFPYIADLEEKSLQRYCKDIASNRRCFFCDVVFAVTRGLEPATKFGMQAVTGEDQVAACEKLDTLPLIGYDDTKTCRVEVEQFCAAHERFPDKDGSQPGEKELLTFVGKIRARRFGTVINKRQGVIIDFALPLHEEQMTSWEALPYLSCFLWWPHHATVFDEVAQLWESEKVLPTRGPQSSSDALAQKIRRVRTKTLLLGRKAMRPAECEKWDTFPGLWSRRVMKEQYLPSEDFTDHGSRWDFARRPEATCMLACELCGFETNTRKELQRHLAEAHVATLEDGSRASWWTTQRVVEEYRKRLVFYEQTGGRMLFCKVVDVCLFRCDVHMSTHSMWRMKVIMGKVAQNDTFLAKRCRSLFCPW